MKDRFKREKDRARTSNHNSTPYSGGDGRKGSYAPGAKLFNVTHRGATIQSRYAATPEQALIDFAVDRKYGRTPEPIGNTLTIGDRVFVAKEAPQ
jgi:hypothetical protein